MARNSLRNSHCRLALTDGWFGSLNLVVAAEELCVDIVKSKSQLTRQHNPFKVLHRVLSAGSEGKLALQN